MSKDLVIFGNGLGLAICDKFYKLPRVLQESWDDPKVLSDKQKELICNCLDDGIVENKIKAPKEEEELSDLQSVLNACDTISKFETDPANGWLSEHGLQFPKAIRRYFHHASSQFHSSAKRLEGTFASNLIEFVKKKRPHIATLNYDDLLYECFSETEVFKQHMLRDGFFNSRFDFEKHHRLWSPTNEGWFLHLHGSPLFVNRDGSPRKILRSQLGDFRGNNSTHLVLTNADSKPSVINNSEILKTYWDQLEKLLQSETKVTLFGYGGLDKHLNKLLSKHEKNISIRIVEWSGEGIAQDRKKYWSNVFSENELIQLSNVMEFVDW